MSEAQFAMVSEWMVNGNINEFVKANPDANRLKLVGSPPNVSLYFRFIDNRIFDPAGRRCQGVDLYPPAGNDTWRPQRCTFCMPGATLLTH